MKSTVNTASSLVTVLVVVCLLSSAPATAALVKSSDDEGAPFHFALAQAYTQEGSYREALESYAKAVELQPDEPFIRMEYAEFLLRIGRAAVAAEHAAAARRLAPESTDALRLYAHVQRRLAESSTEAMSRARQAFIELHEMAPEDVETAMLLAQLYLSEGAFDTATAVLDETLEARPRNRTLMSLLIESLERGGGGDRAEPRLRDFLERDPAYLRGRLALAEIVGRQGRYEAALEILEAAPETQRDLAELRRSLALAKYRSGDLEGALIEVDAWLETEPGALPGRFLKATLLASTNRGREAEIELRSILDERPGHHQAVSLLSDLYQASGRLEEAAGLLGQTADRLEASDQTGPATQLLLQLLRLRAATENWPEVLSLTDRLADRPRMPGQPASTELQFLRAQALIELDRGAEAEEILAALEGDERIGARAVATLAEINYRSGREEEAIGRLRGLAETDDVDDLILAAQSFQRLELYDESIPVLVRAAGARPDTVQVIFWLGAAYEREGRPADAEREFRRLLDLEPDFAPALNYLGYMFAERGENLEEAVSLVNRAIHLDPENGAYIDSLGWAYFQLGRYDLARNHLEQAADMLGGDPVVFEHLGDLYVAVGEVDRARQTYERALALAGDNASDVRRKLDRLAGRL